MSEIEGNIPVMSSEAPVTGTIETSFIETLPEPLREEPSLKDFKSVDALAKSYTELVKYQGNSIRIPGEDASEEVRSKFYDRLKSVEGVVNINDKDAVYTRLGRPESPDAYKLPEIQGISFDNNALSEFKKLAHTNGWNNDQFNSAVSFYAQEKLAEANEHNQKVAQSQAKLKEVWGQEYNNRIHGAKAAIESYVDGYSDDDRRSLELAISQHPVLLQALSDLYGTLKEKGSLKGTGQIEYGTSVEEAKQKIAEIRGNREISKILHDKGHPDHKTYMKKLEGLYKVVASSMQG